MVNFYVRQIKIGRMTLEQVPARWYEAVKAALEEEDEAAE